MSPIETMAKARHDRLHAAGMAAAWESMHYEYRSAMIREAAADLRALARALRPLLW